MNLDYARIRQVEYIENSFYVFVSKCLTKDFYLKSMSKAKKCDDEQQQAFLQNYFLQVSSTTYRQKISNDLATTS